MYAQACVYQCTHQHAYTYTHTYKKEVLALDKINQGYKITDHISVDGEHYALGEHIKQGVPSPYVVWMTDEEMSSFYFGHYFTEKTDAIADMVKRATYRLFREDEIPLSVDFLAENAIEALNNRFAEDQAKETIREVLMDVLDLDIENNPAQLTEDEIMEAPGFWELAKQAYDNLDHSEENYALRQSLADILMAHPEILPTEVEQLHSVVKIPPEMALMLQDILSIPSAAVPDKYGPLNDDKIISFEFSFENDMKANLTLTPEYSSYANKKLSDRGTPFVILDVLDEDGYLLHSQSYHPETENPTGNGSMTGKYEVSFKSFTLTLELQEDESLRRTGNTFVFHASTESEPYRQHDGETCTICRALTPAEHDVLCTGLMWDAEFPNGDRLHVYDEELALPEPVQAYKPSLSEQISSAQDKVNMSSQKMGAKENQR